MSFPSWSKWKLLRIPVAQIFPLCLGKFPPHKLKSEKSLSHFLFVPGTRLIPRRCRYWSFHLHRHRHRHLTSYTRFLSRFLIILGFNSYVFISHLSSLLPSPVQLKLCMLFYMCLLLNKCLFRFRFLSFWLIDVVDVFS